MKTRTVRHEASMVMVFFQVESVLVGIAQPPILIWISSSWDWPGAAANKRESSR